MSELFVDCAALHVGAGRCGDAADVAAEGASRFAAEPLPSGIFGDFGEAQQFHAAVTTAHGDHVDLLNDHHQQLSGIKQRAQADAGAFAAQEAANTRLIGSAKPGSGAAG